jgi:hypothetical protein
MHAINATCTIFIFHCSASIAWHVAVYLSAPSNPLPCLSSDMNKGSDVSLLDPISSAELIIYDRWNRSLDRFRRHPLSRFLDFDHDHTQPHGTHAHAHPHALQTPRADTTHGLYGLRRHRADSFLFIQVRCRVPVPVAATLTCAHTCALSIARICSRGGRIRRTNYMCVCVHVQAVGTLCVVRALWLHTSLCAHVSSSSTIACCDPPPGIARQLALRFSPDAIQFTSTWSTVRPRATTLQTTCRASVESPSR